MTPLIFNAVMGRHRTLERVPFVLHPAAGHHEGSCAHQNILSNVARRHVPDLSRNLRGEVVIPIVDRIWSRSAVSSCLSCRR